MLRMIGIVSFSILLLTACSEGGTERSFVSEAVASPVAVAPDYGWRTDMSPTATEESNAKDYD